MSDRFPASPSAPLPHRGHWDDSHVRCWRHHLKTQRDTAFRRRFVRNPKTFLRNGQTDPRLAQHVMDASPVRSFSFSIPQRGSFGRFEMTWTPGHVTLTGDVGAMGLTHYGALGKFADGMRWLRESDVPYLLEKSSAKRMFDPDATFDFIRTSANEAAIRAVLGMREDMASYRRAYRDAVAEHALAVAEQDGIDASPDLEDFLPDPVGYYVPFSVEKKRNVGGPWLEDHEKFKEPDGFEGWFHIWAYLTKIGEILEGPEAVFTATGRSSLKNGVKNVIDGGERDAAELCANLGFDDYFGSYDYSDPDRFRIAALKHGAGMILRAEAAGAESAAVA